MPNTSLIPYSNTTGNTPSSLVNGQLGINQADGKLFYRNASGVVTQLPAGGGGGGGSTSASDLTSGTLAPARLPPRIRAAARIYAWSAFR